jgi:mRNA interferase MazF
VKRGDVYMAEFEPRNGSEQRGRRPCIVMLGRAFLEIPTWNSVVVIPISSVQKRAYNPYSVVELDEPDNGLSVKSFALCHQVTTLDKRKFIERLGKLTPQQLQQVEAGLKQALDIR